MIGAEYKQRLASELKAQRESNKSPKPDLKATRGRPATGDLLTKAAKVVGVHRARVAEASKVLREAPEKVPAIKAGKLTVGKAVKQIEARKPKPKKDLSCGLTRDSSLRSLFGKADANDGAIYVEIGDYGVRVRRLTVSCFALTKTTLPLVAAHILNAKGFLDYGVKRGLTSHEDVRLTITKRVEVAKALRGQGMSERKIAKVIGVSRSAIHRDLGGSKRANNGSKRATFGK